MPWLTVSAQVSLAGAERECAASTIPVGCPRSEGDRVRHISRTVHLYMSRAFPGGSASHGISTADLHPTTRRPQTAGTV